MKKLMLMAASFAFVGLAVAPAWPLAEAGKPCEIAHSSAIQRAAAQTSETFGKKAENPVSASTSPAEKTVANRFEVAVGQTFVITLASNVTTGYHWELAASLNQEVVELVSSEYKASETKLVGVGGQEIWTFRAVGRGQIIINLKYVRPWEKDVAPVETASYTVVVR